MELLEKWKNDCQTSSVWWDMWYSFVSLGEQRVRFPARIKFLRSYKVKANIMLGNYPYKIGNNIKEIIWEVFSCADFMLHWSNEVSSKFEVDDFLDSFSVCLFVTL